MSNLNKLQPDTDVSSFDEIAQIEPTEALQKELDNILNLSVPENCFKDVQKEFSDFVQLFKTFHRDSNDPIDWKQINLIPNNQLKEMNNLKQPNLKEIKQLLNQLVVLKLNGGLGTSMGCVGPKSVISVRNDMNFLDMIVKQLENLNQTYGSEVPLVLMNSFNTHEDTKKIVNRYKHSKVKIYTFLQRKYPRLIKDTLLPMVSVYHPFDPEGWYPPGHGDIYSSFDSCGLLDMFIQNGKTWLFLSNVDNLGATVDLAILNELVSTRNCDFLMEVTEKTRADIKGGTLIDYNGKVTLLEAAQVPKDKLDEFMSIQKFNIFNTNNLWVGLKKMKELVATNKISMEIIVNPKTLDNGKTVLQLEQAAGAAIKSFDYAYGLRVPRSRFLPVKTTSDLMLVKSNLYDINEGELALSNKRRFPGLPLIKLGPQFKNIKQFMNRVPKIPDILELDHLTVFGDVKFSSGISLRGTVIIIAQEGDHIDIPSGSVLENKIVTGNLHILDH